MGFILLIGIILFFWHSTQIIGEVSGLENEDIILNNGMTFHICNDSHTIKDKGWILGRVIGSYQTTYFVFSVRGVDPNEMIYVASMGDGAFYQNTELQ